MRLYLILLVYVSLINWTTGQDLDSLEIVAMKTPIDSSNVQALHSLTKSIFHKDKEKAQNYAERGVVLCDSLGIINFKVEFLRYKALLKSGSNEEYELLDEARLLAIENNLENELVRVLFNLASYHKGKGENEKAKELNIQLLELDKFKDPKQYLARGSIKYQLGNIYKREGDFKNSQTLLLSIISELDTISGNSVKVNNLKFAVLNSLGSLMEKIKNEEYSANYYHKALQLLDHTEDNRRYTIYNNLGSLYSNSNKLDSAVIYYNKVIDGESTDYSKLYAYQGMGTVLYKNNSKEETLSVLNLGKNLAIKLDKQPEIGLFNSLLGQLSFKNHDYKQSLDYLKKAELQLSDSKMIPELQECKKFILKNKAKLNSNITFHELSSYLSLTDSLYTNDINASIAEIETKYQTEKKEAENQLLKKDQELKEAQISRQRLGLIGGGIGIGLLSLLLFLLYRQSKKRKLLNYTLASKNQQIETLHKDLAHRVKNNLAFMSALLNMQQNRLEDSEAKSAIKEGQMRLESMSLLHRKLYLKETSQVDLKNYIEELSTTILNTYPSEKNKIQINTNIEEISLNGESAMRIGLIINELMTNTFKYAFQNIKEPLITIDLNKNSEGDILLNYFDNGSGHQSTIDLEQSDSLGIKLVTLLTKQLNGVFKTLNKGGLSYQFSFNKIAL